MAALQNGIKIFCSVPKSKSFRPYSLPILSVTNPKEADCRLISSTLGTDQRIRCQNFNETNIVTNKCGNQSRPVSTDTNSYVTYKIKADDSIHNSKISCSSQSSTQSLQSPNSNSTETIELLNKAKASIEELRLWELSVKNVFNIVKHIIIKIEALINKALFEGNQIGLKLNETIRNVHYETNVQKCYDTSVDDRPTTESNGMNDTNISSRRNNNDSHHQTISLAYFYTKRPKRNVFTNEMSINVIQRKSNSTDCKKSKEYEKYLSQNDKMPVRKNSYNKMPATKKSTCSELLAVSAQQRVKEAINKFKHEKIDVLQNHVCSLGDNKLDNCVSSALSEEKQQLLTRQVYYNNSTEINSIENLLSTVKRSPSNSLQEPSEVPNDSQLPINYFNRQNTEKTLQNNDVNKINKYKLQTFESVKERCVKNDTFKNNNGPEDEASVTEVIKPDESNHMKTLQSDVLSIETSYLNYNILNVGKRLKKNLAARMNFAVHNKHNNYNDRILYDNNMEKMNSQIAKRFMRNKPKTIDPGLDDVNWIMHKTGKFKHDSKTCQTSFKNRFDRYKNNLNKVINDYHEMQINHSSVTEGYQEPHELNQMRVHGNKNKLQVKNDISNVPLNIDNKNYHHNLNQNINYINKLEREISENVISESKKLKNMEKPIKDDFNNNITTNKIPEKCLTKKQKSNDYSSSPSNTLYKTTSVAEEKLDDSKLGNIPINDHRSDKVESNVELFNNLENKKILDETDLRQKLTSQKHLIMSISFNSILKKEMVVKSKIDSTTNTEKTLGNKKVNKDKNDLQVINKTYEPSHSKKKQDNEMAITSEIKFIKLLKHPNIEKHLLDNMRKCSTEGLEKLFKFKRCVKSHLKNSTNYIYGKWKSTNNKNECIVTQSHSKCSTANREIDNHLGQKTSNTPNNINSESPKKSPNLKDFKTKALDRINNNDKKNSEKFITKSKTALKNENKKQNTSTKMNRFSDQTIVSNENKKDDKKSIMKLENDFLAKSKSKSDFKPKVIAVQMNLKNKEQRRRKETSEYLNNNDLENNIKIDDEKKTIVTFINRNFKSEEKLSDQKLERKESQIILENEHQVKQMLVKNLINKNIFTASEEKAHKRRMEQTKKVIRKIICNNISLPLTYFPTLLPEKALNTIGGMNQLFAMKNFHSKKQHNNNSIIFDDNNECDDNRKKIIRNKIEVQEHKVHTANPKMHFGSDDSNICSRSYIQNIYEEPKQCKHRIKNKPFSLSASSKQRPLGNIKLDTIGKKYIKYISYKNLKQNEDNNLNANKEEFKKYLSETEADILKDKASITKSVTKVLKESFFTDNCTTEVSQKSKEAKSDHLMKLLKNEYKENEGLELFDYIKEDQRNKMAPLNKSEHKYKHYKNGSKKKRNDINSIIREKKDFTIERIQNILKNKVNYNVLNDGNRDYDNIPSVTKTLVADMTQMHFGERINRTKDRRMYHTTRQTSPHNHWKKNQKISNSKAAMVICNKFVSGSTEQNPTTVDDIHLYQNEIPYKYWKERVDQQIMRQRENMDDSVPLKTIYDKIEKSNVNRFSKR